MTLKYFEHPEFSLYQGNSLELLKELPESSVDFIFADPPYHLSNGGLSSNNGQKVNTNKGNWDKSQGLKKDFEFHLSWIQEAKRVLKPEGTICVTGTYHSIYQCGFALQVAKFHILNEIIWFKPHAEPNLTKRFFTASHETLIWAKKDKDAKHTFNYDNIKEWNEASDFIKKPGQQMRTVWVINPPSREETLHGRHPTQKPLELLNRIITASTTKNDLILDPFSGSSTTGISANKLERKFIGIELEKEFLDLSIKRFNDIKTTI